MRRRVESVEAPQVEVEALQVEVEAGLAGAGMSWGRAGLGNE